MTPQECSVKTIKLRYNNIVNNNANNIFLKIFFFPQTKIDSFLWSSKKQNKNKNPKMKTIVKCSFHQSYVPRVSFPTVIQVLEALRLQRRCQGNMVMVPLALHAAACWE